MSTPLQFYTGYYSGGIPVVDNPNPFDVAQDLSTGNLWQYTGNGWVAPGWSSTATIYLSAANTVCERISGSETIIPSYLSVYPGDSELVPAELALSAEDLVIKNSVGNYNIVVNIFRTDSISDTVVSVPYPKGDVISTEDGVWTVIKRFNTLAGFDSCSISMIFVAPGNGAVPQMLEYMTRSDAEAYIDTVVASAGYITSSEAEEYIYAAVSSVVDSAGYITSGELDSKGYITSNELDSKGYVTSNELDSKGYVTSNELDSKGYITSGELDSKGYVTETELDSKGYTDASYVSNAMSAVESSVSDMLASYPTTSQVEESLSTKLSNSGMLITPLADVSGTVTLPATEGKVYTHTLAAGETIVIAAASSGHMPTVELHLEMPSTAVSFTFGTTIWWSDAYGNFASGNAAPDFSTGGEVYALVFRFDGTRWLGNLAYTEA